MSTVALFVNRWLFVSSETLPGATSLARLLDLTIASFAGTSATRSASLSSGLGGSPFDSRREFLRSSSARASELARFVSEAFRSVVAVLFPLAVISLEASFAMNFLALASEAVAISSDDFPASISGFRVLGSRPNSRLRFASVEPADFSLPGSGAVFPCGTNEGIGFFASFDDVTACGGSGLARPGGGAGSPANAHFSPTTTKMHNTTHLSSHKMRLEIRRDVPASLVMVFVDV